MNIMMKIGMMVVSCVIFAFFQQGEVQAEEKAVEVTSENHGISVHFGFVNLYHAQTKLKVVNLFIDGVAVEMKEKAEGEKDIRTLVLPSLTSIQQVELHLLNGLMLGYAWDKEKKEWMEVKRDYFPTIPFEGTGI